MCENDVLVLGALAGPRLSWTDRRVCENDMGAGAIIVPMSFCSAVWPMIHGDEQQNVFSCRCPPKEQNKQSQLIMG